MRNRLALVAAMLTYQVIAQSPIVVDQSGRGDYRDIQSAINSAPPGARIRVRAADYPSFEIDQSLHIFGDPGATITGFPPRITVEGIGASQSVTVSGFRSAGSSPLAITVRNCAGHIHLQDLVVDGRPGDFTHGSAILDSGLVTASNLRLVGSPALVVARSSMTLDACKLDGRVQKNAVALECDQANVTLIDGQYSGGSAVRDEDEAGVAVHMTLGKLTIGSVRGTTLTAGVNLGGEPEPLPAIQTVQGGELVIDPAVQRRGSNGASGIQGDATLVERPVHALTTQLEIHPYFGTILRPTLRASDADRALILLSFSAQAPFGTPLGDLWILGPYLGLVDRRPDAHGRVDGDVHLPIFQPLPPFVLQGVTFSSARGYGLTNATVVQPYSPQIRRAVSSW